MENIYNNELLAQKLLIEFEKNIKSLGDLNFGYKISKYFKKNVDLVIYKNKKIDYVYYLDKNGLDNIISIYYAYDELDDSKGLIIEYIIGNKKDILFFSENTIYNIIENKKNIILKSEIIDNEKNINSILNFFLSETLYISNKVARYKYSLIKKGLFDEYISEFKIKNFYLDFLKNKLKIFI